jgi:prepilin-type N-terminal cleavage/methylation domain-containing protein
MKKGFTLVELLFVMAIISILAGIGIYQMSGFTGTAEDVAAKSELRNVITEAQLYYANNTSYSDFEPSNTDKITVGFVNDKDYCFEAVGASSNFRYNSRTDSAITAGTCPSSVW